MTRHVLKLIWNRKRTNFLVMTEIFVSFLVLCAVVGLGVYAYDNWRKPIGFSYDGVWNISVDMRQVSNDEFSPQQLETIRQVLLALREFPEIERAAGTELPLFSVGASSVSQYQLRGRDVEFGVEEVTDEFKDVLGLRIVEGRWFGPEDAAVQGFDPVVINRAMREEVFGDGPALGENIGPDGSPDASEPPPVKRVIGVVEAFREDGEFDGMSNYVIHRKNLTNPSTFRDRPPRNIIIKVRPGTTAAFEERLIERLRAAAPEWSFSVEPLTEARATAIGFAMAPLVAIGVVAAFLMLMVALGLFGVLWQSVTQRMREIGLRRAKGAARGNVQRQVLAEVALMTTLALAAGLAVAIQVPLLNVFYFVDAHVYAIAFLLSVAAMYALTLACAWYPSRLATRIAPAEALRYE